MIRCYKFRLYPTQQQIRVMNETIETCRHLYNDSLGERSTDWDVGYWEQQNLLPLRKQDSKYLRQVHSQVLQDVLQRLDKAYQAFFKKISSHPKFKRRENYNSFTYPQYGGFRFKEGRLVLSCIGAIKFKMHGGHLIVVAPNGTSKKCSRCEMVAEEKPDLSVRIFECHSCGLVIDRDLNAARNILKLGLEQAHAEKQPLLVRQRISKFALMKQEARTL